MAFPSLESFNETDKLKLTVLCDVRKICNEVGGGLTNKVSFDKQSLELIAEMVWHKVQDYGSDLEHFARHAKRTTVNADDVKLLVRKNESLRERISKMTEDFSSASSSKRRKKDRDSDAGSDLGQPEDNLVGNFDLDDFLDD